MSGKGRLLGGFRSQKKKKEIGLGILLCKGRLPGGFLSQKIKKEEKRSP